MAVKKQFSERREFPRVAVWTKIRVLLRHQRRFLIGEIGNVSSAGMYILTDESLPIGTLLDFEFTLLDEVRPYIGRGEVVRTDCPNGNTHYSCGLGVRFMQIDAKKLKFGEMPRHMAFLRGVAFDIVVDALHYAWAELQGNVTPREFGQPGAGFRKPLLLIHGWFGTRGALSLIEQRLKKEGFPVFSIDLGIPNVKDIEVSAKQVNDKVEKLTKRLGLEKIDILAHSMGGLIGLWGMKKLSLAEHVNKFITIGTPFQGTYMAAVGLPMFGLLGKSLWQMLPGSSFLEDLHQGALPKTVKIFCIAARHDKVAPVHSATLAGATNIMIERGHASLVTGQTAFNRILAILEDKDPFAVH